MMKGPIRKEYRLYRLSAGYGEIKKSCMFLQYLLVIVHLLCGAFLMLLNISDQLQESLPFIGLTISHFQQNYMNKKTSQIISFASIGLSLLFLVTIGIRLSIMPMYNEFNCHKKIDRYLFIATMFIGYTFQFTIYIIGWSIVYVYTNEGPLVFLGVGFLPVIIYTHSNIKLNTTSLYKWLTFPVIFLVTFLQTIFSYILIIGISIYFIFTQKSLLKKISFSLIILLSLFVLKHTIFADSHPKQMFISLISLAILTLLSPLLIFRLQNKSFISNHNTQLQKSYHLLSKIKTSPFNQLKFKQFHILYTTVLNLSITNKDNNCKQTLLILQKLPIKFTKNDFLFLLQKYLQKEIKKSTKNNFHKQIIRFKIRMELNHPLSQMTEQLFYLYEEFLKSNKKYQHQFFQLLDSVISRYCVFKNDALQSAFTFHMNELHQTFQLKIIDLLNQISQFWKNMTHQQIKSTQLNDSFDKLIEKKNSIQNHCKQMEKFGNFQRQRKVINIIKTLFNCYEEENKFSTQHIKNIMEFNEKQIYHQFLILEDSLINFVSNDLLKNLGQKGNSSYQNVDKKALFGEQFSRILDNLIKSMNIETQKQWVTIPILKKDGLIDLKKINILWYPLLETKCRLMIRFSQDVDLRKEGYILYEVRSDTIKYVNEKFITNFGMNKERFLQKLANERMFFNELFTQGDSFSQQIRKYLKEQSVIKCKMLVKGFVEKGRHNMIGVEIKVAKWIASSNGSGYCILRVTKNDQRKGLSSKGRQNQEKQKIRKRQRTLTIKNEILNTNQRSLTIKYEKQKFFCPISNIYESKITQKQAQLSQQNRWVWRYFLHLLVGILFLAIIVLWCLDYKFIQDRISNYVSERIAIQNTSQQYALLYQLYTIVSKKYYIKKYPEQVILATNKTIPTLDTFYKNQQQSYIDQFLRRYLTQINQQPNKNIAYNLQFQYFNITSDSQRSTLVDFAQKFKKNIVNNEIDFLLRNYDSFRNLTIDYENSFIYDQFVQNVVASYNIYSFILIASTLSCACLIFYTLIKIQAAILVIYSLFQLITIKQFQQNCINFKQKMQKIINSLHRSVSQSNMMNHNNQSNQIASNSTNTMLTVTQINHQPQSQSTINSQLNDIFPQTSSFNDSICQTDTNENEINERKSLLSQNHSQAKVKRKQRFIGQPFLLKINRKLYFIFVLIGLNVAFFLDFRHIIEQKNGIIQVFDIRRSLYVSLLHVKRIQTDAIIQPVMFDYFNKTVHEPYQTLSIDLATDISQQLIFQELQNFKEKSRLFLATDMCSTIGKVLTQNIKPCNYYLKGIVTKGFGQTFDIFQLNAKNLSAQSLYDFGSFPCNTKNCTLYYEHVYVSALMGETIRAVLKILNQQSIKLDQVRFQKTYTRILYKMVIVFYALMVYVLYNKKLRKRCKRSIDYFKFIPKELMCTMKITSYMRKNEILSQFDIL